MIILPAIDMIGGQCVRLIKGDYATAHKVAEDPFETAARFAASGAGYLHMVDLDGAKAKEPKNADTICRIARACAIPCEVGGGIRSMQSVEMYLENGVSRVILGSSALSDPEFVRTAVRAYGERIAVGIDALERSVRVTGWTEDSGVDFIEFAKQMEDIGVKNIIFTDISRDGTLTGPNLAQLSELKQAVSCDITASGGVTNIGDIRALKELDLYGAICGKSLYSGSLSLDEAVALCAAP